MTARYVLASVAERDIEDIAEFIRSEDASAARAVVRQIYDAFSLLAEQPKVGHLRRDLTMLPVRFWTVRGRYLIVYRDASEPLEIARVLCGARDIAALLGDDQR